MLASFVTCARCAHIQSEVFDPEAEARHPDHTRGEDCAFSIASYYTRVNVDALTTPSYPTIPDTLTTSGTSQDETYVLERALAFRRAQDAQLHRAAQPDLDSELSDDEAISSNI